MRIVNSRRIQNLIVMLTLACLSAACFKSSPNPSETPIEIPSANVNLANPLEISNLPEDIKLCELINKTIDASEFSNARWGVIVVSLKNGRITCSRDAQKLFNPASTQKIITSAAALDKLGSDFRWKTSVYAAKPIEGNTVNGDLILYGRGAPDLDERSLDRLAADLKDKGLKRVNGNVIGDESFFKGDKFGDGWSWGELQWYYGAEASALTYNENQTEISLKDGKPVSANDYVTTRSEVKPAQDIEAIGVKREVSENEVYVWGNGTTLNTRISVNKPALWASRVLKEKLEKYGIEVTGEAKMTDWKSAEKADISNAVELAFTESQTLGEVVRKMNKDSVNLYAELILRTLGKNFGESAPDENPKMNKLRGDDSAGASVMKKWLLENNLGNSEIAVHDGSGLSRLDYISPEVMGKTILFASQSKFADLFKKSLPIAATDGTLRGRLPNLPGRVMAKTGSMTYINSLAGFAQRANGETVAFTVFINNQTSRGDSSGAIDAVVSLISK